MVIGRTAYGLLGFEPPPASPRKKLSSGGYLCGCKYHECFRARGVALPGQTRNDAGGFAYPLEPRQQLERFLILGTEGGTYYVSEQRLTLENVKAVLELLYQEPAYVLERTATISEQGRALQERPALFVLALALASGRDAVRTLALEAMPRIVRTGTHLFTFVDYLTQLRGWGRAARRAVAHWYQAPTCVNWHIRSPSIASAMAGRIATCSVWRTRKADTAERNALLSLYPHARGIGGFACRGGGVP